MRFRQLFCKKMIRADPNRSESEVSKLMAPHDRHRTTIAVVAVPANSGGGLTILRDLHGWAVKHNEYNWIFVVSTPVLAEYPHIRVVNIPWIKRSWIHRLLFDVARSWRIIRNMGADVILSLQNTSILWARVPQLVYVHQPLPFTPRHYAITRSPRMWAYQNLVGRLIRRSIGIAEVVVVQSSWMKESIQRLAPQDSGKVMVVPPLLNIKYEPFEPASDAWKTFFYPASGAPYKNHITLIRAAILLLQQNTSDFQVDLTLTSEELNRAARPVEIPDNVNALGQLSFALVQKKYQHCTLVFPSTLETFGLPLQEARILGTPILAADEPYAREVLAGYDNCKFFQSEDSAGLAAAMAQVMSGGLQGADQPTASALEEESDPWETIVVSLVRLSADPSEETTAMYGQRHEGEDARMVEGR